MYNYLDLQYPWVPSLRKYTQLPLYNEVSLDYNLQPRLIRTAYSPISDYQRILYMIINYNYEEADNINIKLIESDPFFVDSSMSLEFSNFIGFNWFPFSIFIFWIFINSFDLSWTHGLKYSISSSYKSITFLFNDLIVGLFLIMRISFIIFKTTLFPFSYFLK